MIRDLRWRLAFWIWCPAAWVEERLHHERAPVAHAIQDDIDRLRFWLSPPPLRYRLARRLIVDPLSWLSDRIYPLWFEDERTRLDYWRRG